MLPILLLALLGSAFGNYVEIKHHTTNATTHWDQKIINGVDANERQYPYIVSLNYAGDGHACGAAVLTNNWVLTAAHCCLTGNPMEIYAGSIYLSGGGQRYPISRYIVHGDYQPDQHWRNDICLINLGSPLQYNDNVQPISLPPRGLNIPNGDQLMIVGWGTLANGQGPDRLQALPGYTALTNDDCRGRTGVDVYSGQICAQGGQGHGVCSGDSGGPLTRNGIHVGITSFVFLPCGGGSPDFYTRTSEYVDWINQVLGSEAKDLRYGEYY